MQLLLILPIAIVGAYLVLGLIPTTVILCRYWLDQARHADEDRSLASGFDRLIKRIKLLAIEVVSYLPSTGMTSVPSLGALVVVAMLLVQKVTYS